MPCETCGHTMQSLTGMRPDRIFWCQRCGTLKMECGSFSESVPPLLIERVRRFRELCNGGTGLLYDSAALWHRLGIAESIELPDNRLNDGKVSHAPLQP